jgi:hypothetical protein
VISAIKFQKIIFTRQISWHCVAPSQERKVKFKICEAWSHGFIKIHNLLPLAQDARVFMGE